MYADDGFLYSDQPFRAGHPPGIFFAKDKSRWIKKDGRCLHKEVKFLGTVYDLETEELAGKTRSGKELKASTKVKDLKELLNKMDPEYNKSP